jgi:hypothetical protein
MPLGGHPNLVLHNFLHDAYTNFWGRSDTNISINYVWNIVHNVIIKSTMEVRTFEIKFEEFNLAWVGHSMYLINTYFPQI